MQELLKSQGLLQNFGKVSKKPNLKIDSRVAAFAQKAGFMTFEQMQNLIAEEGKEKQLQQIWQPYEGREKPTHLSGWLLGHIDKIRQGGKIWISEKAFDFGKAFEEYLTKNTIEKTERYPTLDISDFDTIAQCARKARESELLMEAVGGWEQQTKLDGVRFGYRVKGRTDFMKPDKSRIVELKTTKAKSRNEFIRACHDFGYFAQGWLYCQLSGAPRYTIIAIPKNPSIYGYWEVEMTAENFVEGEATIARQIQNLVYYGIEKQFKVC
ncbi:MAG: PD-(D/E)XK nuclease-like domain-containing protein [Bacteroidales bacterium]